MTEPAPTEQSTRPPAPPPRWKFAIIVLLGLYPLLIIMLPLMARLFDVPLVFGLAFLVRTLITVLVVVPLMVWGAIPLLSRVLRNWLEA